MRRAFPVKQIVNEKREKKTIDQKHTFLQTTSGVKSLDNDNAR